MMVIPWHTRFPNLMSLGFPKDSPYFPFINHKLVKLIESGKFKHIYRRWVPQVRISARI